MFHRRRRSLDVVASMECVCFPEKETQFSPTLNRVDPGSENWFIKTKLKLVIANFFTVKNLTSEQLEFLCPLLTASFSWWQGFQKVTGGLWMARVAHVKPWCVLSRPQSRSAKLFLLFTFISSSWMALLLGIQGLIDRLGSKTWLVTF